MKKRVRTGSKVATIGLYCIYRALGENEPNLTAIGQCYLHGPFRAEYNIEAATISTCVIDALNDRPQAQSGLQNANGLLH